MMAHLFALWVEGLAQALAGAERWLSRICDRDVSNFARMPGIEVFAEHPRLQNYTRVPMALSPRPCLVWLLNRI
jgi:hypothetical protein